MENCVSVGCPEVLRISLQDQCSGERDVSADSAFIMRCLRGTTLVKRIKEGETSSFDSDCGAPDEDIEDSQVQGYDLTFETARFSPELEAKTLGLDLLVVDGVNVGVLEEASVGCASLQVRPTYLVEAFFRLRNCDVGGSADRYKRYVIPGFRFQPVELDAENRIRFQRFTASSRPMYTAGLINPGVGPALDTGGPFKDFPQDLVDQLALKPVGNVMTKLDFVDTTVDPTSAATLSPGTCYTATLPA